MECGSVHTDRRDPQLFHYSYTGTRTIPGRTNNPNLAQNNTRGKYSFGQPLRYYARRVGTLNNKKTSNSESD